MHPGVTLQEFPFIVESIFLLDALLPFLHPSSRWEPSCWSRLCPEEEGALPLNQKSHCLQAWSATGSRAADAALREADGWKLLLAGFSRLLWKEEP